MTSQKGTKPGPQTKTLDLEKLVTEGAYENGASEPDAGGQAYRVVSCAGEIRSEHISRHL
jgi:hypothetical protein